MEQRSAQRFGHGKTDKQVSNELGGERSTVEKANTGLATFAIADFLQGEHKFLSSSELRPVLREIDGERFAQGRRNPPKPPLDVSHVHLSA